MGGEEVLGALQILLDGLCDAVLFAFGNFGIAQRDEGALTRLPLGIAIGLNELHKGSAFDSFCSEIHAGEHIREAGGKTIKIVQN
jgi:hypothetical protein